MADPDSQIPEERRALFRVVRGLPDDEELAALTAVLAGVATSASARAATEDERSPSVWLDRRAALRQPLYPGPDPWQASELPRQMS